MRCPDKQLMRTCFERNNRRVSHTISNWVKNKNKTNTLSFNALSGEYPAYALSRFFIFHYCSCLASLGHNWPKILDQFMNMYKHPYNMYQYIVLKLSHCRSVYFFIMIVLFRSSKWYSNTGLKWLTALLYNIYKTRTFMVKLNLCMNHILFIKHCVMLTP